MLYEVLVLLKSWTGVKTGVDCKTCSIYWQNNSVYQTNHS